MRYTKKKTVYLHLGTYKTATTFLQRVLWKSFDKPGGDIYFPRVGIFGNAHHYLTTEHFPGWTNGVAPAEYEKTWKRLLADIGGSQAASIVLSSEMFCSISLAKIRYIREMLDDYSVRAILYLRRQDQFSSSLAAQLVKGCNGKPEIYADLNRAIQFSCSGNHFDYENICDRWASVIGAENLVVRPYERQQLHGGDILSDFFYHLMGIPIPENVALPNRNLNPRLCRDALEFKQLVNRMPTDRETMIATMPALLAYSASMDTGTHNTFQEHVLLSPSQRLEILQRCDDGNARIAREYLGREDGVLFTESLPDMSAAWEPYPGLNNDTLDSIVHFLGERNPGIVGLLVRAAPRVDQADKDLKALSRALLRYGKKNKSVFTVIPTSFLISRPVRLMGKVWTKIRNKPPVISAKSSHPAETDCKKESVPALFLHIRKTGGTSIVRQAMEHYGYENVCGHGDYMGRTPESFSKLPFVSGHFGIDYARALMPDRFSFTFLRDPIERIISLYYFCRVQDPDEFPIYRAASEHDLHGFLQAADTDDLVWSYIWNSQVWCLAQGPGLTEYADRTVPPDEMYKQALANASQLSFIGFTETFDRDARLVLGALNMTLPDKIRKDNVTSDKIPVAELPDRTIQLLLEVTQWDQKLYDVIWRRRNDKINSSNHNT